MSSMTTVTYAASSMARPREVATGVGGVQKRRPVVEGSRRGWRGRKPRTAPGYAVSQGTPPGQTRSPIPWSTTTSGHAVGSRSTARGAGGALADERRAAASGVGLGGRVGRRRRVLQASCDASWGRHVRRDGVGRSGVEAVEVVPRAARTRGRGRGRGAGRSRPRLYRAAGSGGYAAGRLPSPLAACRCWGTPAPFGHRGDEHD